MSFDRFDVVRVPFPFTDRTASKRRPALVLSDAQSFNSPAGHSVMVMITSVANPPWPLDCPLPDLRAAGLPAPSKVRFKLFTLDHRLVLGRLGSLSVADRRTVQAALHRLFGTRTARSGPTKGRTPWRTPVYAEARAEMLKCCGGKLPPVLDPFAGGRRAAGR